MKRRYRYTLNLFSFGLLLFALYLNFIKKEAADVSAPDAGSPATSSLQNDAKPVSVKSTGTTTVLK